jgi:hypothetical protein
MYMNLNNDHAPLATKSLGASEMRLGSKTQFSNRKLINIFLTVINRKLKKY